GGVHEAVCATTGDALLEPQCDGVAHECKQTSIDCGSYFCAAQTGADACATGCMQHSDCPSGICDLHFGRLNQCVPEGEVCFVSTVHCAASGGVGSRANPYCRIGNCVAGGHTYISVDDGVYQESVRLQVDTLLVAPGSTRPASTGVRAKIEAPRNYAITTNGRKLGLYGFELTHAVNAEAPTALLLGAGAGITVDSSYIHHGYAQCVKVDAPLTIRHSSIDWCALGGVEASMDVTLEDSWVMWNSFGGKAPGIESEQGRLKMVRTRVEGNGAGVKVVGGSLAMENCSVSNNVRYGISLDAASGSKLFPSHIRGGLIVGNWGLGIVATRTEFMVINVTLAHNNTESQTQVLCNDRISFENSIIWDTEPDVLPYAGTQCIFSHSNVQGLNTSGTTNISADPQFVTNSYTLMGSSPCIDSGNNQAFGIANNSGFNDGPFTKDLAGAPRISNTTIDMGAYEYR
ncbi:MAG: hypothetical protein JRH20_30890, partial [Deltaproteobacteria bacterium]|nr:hypothetical protein [Deltaproteobacteria bacterium]